MLYQARKRFYYWRKFSTLGEQWAYFLANQFNSSKKTRFVIFGQGRTGSTLLIRLLNQHADIACDNELFQKDFQNPVKYLEGRSLMTSKHCYGLKLIPYQLRKYTSIQYSKPLVEQLFQKGWKIIYLKRNNFFRHALSNLLAQQRGYFFRDQREFNSPPKAHIDLEKLKGELNARFAFRAEEEEALENITYKEIIYEDDLLTAGQRERGLEVVCRYLEVVPHAPKTPFLRSTTDDLSALIENYEEVVKVAEKCGVGVY